jgi:hypothetical protein
MLKRDRVTGNLLTSNGWRFLSGSESPQVPKGFPNTPHVILARRTLCQRRALCIAITVGHLAFPPIQCAINAGTRYVPFGW